MQFSAQRHHRAEFHACYQQADVKLLLSKFLKAYFPFPLDWSLQFLAKGYKRDPDTRAHPLVARAVFR